jgi:hypothetical protein
LLPYLAFVVFLAMRAHRLRERVAELVDMAAHRIGLQRILRRKKPAAAAGSPEPMDQPAQV